MGDTTVLEREMFSSGCRPRLENARAQTPYKEFTTTSTATRASQNCIFDNENNLFARFARAFFIFLHFADVLVLSTTLNDLFCHWVDDVII